MNHDLISRSALRVAMAARGITAEREAQRLLEAAPAVDVVHAAGGCYCRECSMYRILAGAEWCQEYGGEVTETDFCSRGKNKGGSRK